MAGLMLLAGMILLAACANLGGWMIVKGARLPVRLRVHQGEQTKRPSLLVIVHPVEDDANPVQLR